LPVRKISHLRYLALAMPNLEEEAEFFTKYWGLTEVNRENDTVWLGTEGSPEPYQIRLRKDDKRIDLIGFGALNRTDVDALYSELEAKGVKMIHEPKPLPQFGGGYGFRCFDIDGRTIEVATEFELKASRKINEREPIPVKLSHVVINTNNLAATTQWYIDNLDFSLSDTLIHPKMGEMMNFMRCNPAHHSIAIVQGPHHSLHHMSFEMRGIEEWMRGTGKILRTGTRMVWGPGRHNAGDNTFAYFIDPAGNTVEYTTELHNIEDEDSWHPSKMDITQVSTADQWGTANPMSEFVARESFNDIDKGLFVAPPV
jgi:catechol-2,3-dioxygenase